MATRINRPGIEARLATAAQAEAVRKDADLIRARDLELAGRAAGAIAALRGANGSGQTSAERPRSKNIPMRWPDCSARHFESSIACLSFS